MSTSQPPSASNAHRQTTPSPRTPRSLCLTDRYTFGPRPRDEAGLDSTRRGRSLGRSLSSTSSSTSPSPSKAAASRSKKDSSHKSEAHDIRNQQCLGPSRGDEPDLILVDSSSEIKRRRKQRSQESQDDCNTKPQILGRALTDRDRSKQRYKHHRRSDFAAKKITRLEREKNPQSQQWNQLSNTKQNSDHEHSHRTPRSA